MTEAVVRPESSDDAWTPMTLRSWALYNGGAIAGGILSAFLFSPRRESGGGTFETIAFGVITGLLICNAVLAMLRITFPLMSRLESRGKGVAVSVTAGLTSLLALAFSLTFILPWIVGGSVNLDGWGRRGILVGLPLMLAIAATIHSINVMKDRLRRSMILLKEREIAEKELEFARAVQKRLLPPETVIAEGLKIEARNLAARWVAGDFYDVLTLREGAVAAVVADVAGKGVAASLTVASVKAVLPLLAGKPVPTMMRELNDKLKGELGRREFVALAFANIDPKSGTVVLANAGIPDPFLMRANGTLEIIAAPGPRLPLGARRGIEYEAITLRLEIGDRLFLFSDGLPEATAVDGSQVGEDRLAMIARQNAGRPLAAWVDGILESVVGSGIPDDDCTVLAIERTR